MTERTDDSISDSDEKDGTLIDDEDDESKKSDGKTSNEDVNSKFIFYSKSLL